MSKTEKRNYQIPLTFFNGKIYNEVIIDSHYEEKHSSDINDELILILVRELHQRYELKVEAKGAFEYFVTRIEHKAKWYRLIWVIEKDCSYIGVINAFRDKKGE